MSWICLKCGATGTPGRVINQVCDCGSPIEDIDTDILKALLPFGPEKPKPRPGRLPFASATMLAGIGSLFVGAAYALYAQERMVLKKKRKT